MKKLLLFSFMLFTAIQLQAQGWGQTQKIVPSDREAGDFFGRCVDMDGDYAVVGSYWDDVNTSNVGSVYIYKKDTNGNWLEHQNLTASDKRQNDLFGEYVDIDGNFIIVGARGQDYDENNANFESGTGAAYIFENDGNGNWNEVQKIVSLDRGDTSEAFFGQTVTISGDYAVVNAARESTGLDGQQDLFTAGACYIFERDANGVWIGVQKIVSSDREANERFGEFSVAIDNETIIVGSSREGLDNTGGNELENAGAVYVFERDTNGTWNETQKLVTFDRALGDAFGRSVSIDSNSLIVGADYKDTSGNASGSAYIFEKNNGVWNEVQKLTASSGLAVSRFGQSVDMDGDRILIGAFWRDIGSIDEGGAAYIFEKYGTDFWNETATLYDPDASITDYFGFSVAISGDYCFVSANEEKEDENNENTLQDAGSAFIFNVNEPNTLAPLNTLSIFESDFEASIKAYPNPVKEMLNINLGRFNQKVLIEVFNYLGQKIISKKYTNIETLALPFEVSKGMYLVFVKTNESTTILKVLKQ